MTDVRPDRLRSRLAAGENLVILDVREADEVAGQPFPGAVHIPIGQLADRVGEIPHTRPIVVVCHSGVRSAAAADALDRAGWPAENLAGGIVAWMATEPGA
ncbi:MAG: rhodanese-like domain-containing protein [Acidimicrobiales bacterium]